MAEELELLRQQLAEVTANLAERDATLAERDATVATERALRMSAETAAQGGTAVRRGRPTKQERRYGGGAWLQHRQYDFGGQQEQRLLCAWLVCSCMEWAVLRKAWYIWYLVYIIRQKH